MTLKQIRDNPLLLTDGYNTSHGILKCNTDWEISHVYMRKKAGFLYGFNEIVTDLLNTKIEVDMVMEASELCMNYGVKFPTKIWMDVVDKLDGWLPLKVQALPDGTWCPKGTPFASISNTDEGYGELVTWFEPQLLQASFASAALTEAYYISEYLKTNNLPNHRIHSFGLRGHNSLENAYWAGTAWAIFLHGSDDLHILKHTDKNAIKSIPASAHKVVQQFNTENQAYSYGLKRIAEEGYKIVAMPIDTYDPINFIRNYAESVAEYAQDLGVHIVFRPDSGDVLQQAILLYEKIGTKFDNTSVIIGESIDLNVVKNYDQRLLQCGVPLEYVSYGMGAGFYKNLNRDTLGFAMKTAYSNGQSRMKLSADPLKESIPGNVNVGRADNGQLQIQFGTPTLYETIYEMDEHSSRPKTLRHDWRYIRDNALAQDTSQQQILISKEVQLHIQMVKDRLG